jgi:uncharacterized protein (TIGR02444 family)
MAANSATDSPVTAPGNTRRSHSELWRYALHTYAQPGVADEMLRLQDECGADVLWLLTALWLAEEDVALTSELLIQPEYDDWRENMIVPIRNRRRECDRTETPDLYELLKKAELEAEREGLRRLFLAFSGSDKGSDKSSTVEAEDNLMLILKDKQLCATLVELLAK